jgi:hypothetical protein
MKNSYYRKASRIYYVMENKSWLARRILRKQVLNDFPHIICDEYKPSSGCP